MSKFMRVIVFFDLPVGTKAERSVATRFRNDLLKNGYYMMQFSVYARLCNGVESANMHINRIQSIAPYTGSVRCLLVTEKQYASIRIIAGEKKKEERPASFVQLSFL